VSAVLKNNRRVEAAPGTRNLPWLPEPHNSHSFYGAIMYYFSGTTLGADMNGDANTLTEKIKTLSAEQIVEVEDFVEFIRLRGQERGLTRTASAVSAPAFEAVWSNLEDAAYDAL